MSQQEMKTFWKCSKCGFNVEASSPPKNCPQCQEACEFKDVGCYLPECGGPGNVDPRL